MDSPEQKEARIARAKKDYKFMIETYFSHYATCESADFHIEFARKIKRNPTIKAFAEWPRGHAKSVHVNIFLPFWLWINDQCHYMVLIGNSFDKAAQLLDDLKAEFESNQKIITDFGPQKNLGQWESGDFKTKGGFMAKALGAGQSVRGLRKGAQRPDYCVGDDNETRELVKNPKRQDELAQWVERDLIPTMDGPIRRFIWANNRYAPRMVQTVLQKKHPKWWVHHIKAYDHDYNPRWHQKYTPQYWRDMEEELGILACKAEFNQDPHTEGKLFKNEYFRYEKIPRIDHYDAIVGYWDVAYSGNNDYNAVRIWGKKGKKYYLIKSFVRQSTMDEAIRWMFYFKMLNPRVWIPFWYESQFWNKTLQDTYDEIRADFGFDIGMIKDDSKKGKKYDRIVSELLPLYQQGRMIYNEKEYSSNDHSQGEEQTKGIEPGYNSHDDAPDADQGAISKLSQHISSTANPHEKPIMGSNRRPSHY
ncbi:hypothetical protein [Persicobacter sp. CCB-QB2]|uniref:hypothetical protein n=1 Tax=Persicobacter sp. CCB-QB2 TaxID=1561025 RepID=UPI0006A96878|nr:hypothetical protein [Persicobacter sp. CCB-QB2]